MSNENSGLNVHKSNNNSTCITILDTGKYSLMVNEKEKKTLSFESKIHRQAFKLLK